MSMARIDQEFKFHGLCLLVDTKGRLVVWGLPRERNKMAPLLVGREDEMTRFLIARALR